MHTNYYQIYDIGRKKWLQIVIHTTENIFIIVYIVIAFMSNNVGVILFITLSFGLAMFIFYIIAIFYFLLVYKEDRGEERKQFDKNKYIKSTMNNEMIGAFKNMPHIMKSYELNNSGEKNSHRGFINENI
jgi:hypothetical protein